MISIPQTAWREGVGQFDPHRIATPILDCLREQVDLHPDHPAIQEPGHSITYAELWSELRQQAGGIAAAQTDDGPVAIVLPAGIRHGVSVLACLAAGRICMPVDPTAPPQRIEALLQAAGVKQAFGPAQSLPSWCRTVVADPEGRLQQNLDTSAPAFISPTSGSSGQPKLVVHHQRALAFQAWGNVAMYNLTAADRFVFVGAPASFSALIHLLSPLLAGGAAIACDLRTAGLARLLDIMEQQRASVLRIGPALLRSLLGLPRARTAFRHLRSIRMVGEPLRYADVSALRAVLPPDVELINAYGATETVPFEYRIPIEANVEDAIVPSGFLRSGGAFVLLDDQDRPCADGESGELVVRSRYGAIGEWVGGACVPGRLLSDPADTESRIYRTGDHATLAPDGALVVLGRFDRQIKINGNRVDLSEVEAQLRQLPGVDEAVAITCGHIGRTEIVAFVSGTAAVVDEARRRVAEHLPGYAVPSQIIWRETIPLLPSGKPDVQSLRTELAGGARSKGRF